MKYVTFSTKFSVNKNNKTIVTIGIGTSTLYGRHADCGYLYCYYSLPGLTIVEKLVLKDSFEVYLYVSVRNRGECRLSHDTRKPVFRVSDQV